VLNDLAALAPPLLVCAAFLVAVGAFLRHEMRHADSPPQDESADFSAGSSNPGSSDPNQDAPSGTAPGHDAAQTDRTDGGGVTSDG
jgi:hypothetical protein